MPSRLVRIRYNNLPENTLVQAWITTHGSVVICVNSELTKHDRIAAVKQALKATQIDADKGPGRVGIVVPANPGQDVRDDTKGAS